MIGRKGVPDEQRGSLVMSQELPEWLQKILAEPTCSVPNAGRALGIKGRNQRYAAAASGQMKTIWFGRTLRVPTVWLRRQLMLDESDR